MITHSSRLSVASVLPERGLVENQNPRPGGESRSDREATFLAPGEHEGIGVLHVLQAETFQDA